MISKIKEDILCLNSVGVRRVTYGKFDILAAASIWKALTTTKNIAVVCGGMEAIFKVGCETI